MNSQLFAVNQFSWISSIAREYEMKNSTNICRNMHKADLIIISLKLTCSRHAIAEKLLSWREPTITHSLYTCTCMHWLLQGIHEFTYPRKYPPPPSQITKIGIHQFKWFHNIYFRMNLAPVIFFSFRRRYKKSRLYNNKNAK